MAISPMMQHYLQMKEKYKDCILFYRLGDFYEFFFEDAELCSRVLELTLTGKDCGLESRAPMCGIPYMAAENYISILIENGYKVAICEQLTVPQKGVKLVERDVVRIVTPGTVVDSSMLQENKNNYIASVYMKEDSIGVSIIDITTGEFKVCEFIEGDILTKLNDFLVTIRPSEILCNDEMYEHFDSLQVYRAHIIPAFYNYGDDNYVYKTCNEQVLKQLNVDSLKPFNIANKKYAITSAGALIKYILETQKRDLTHINSVSIINQDNYMQIDANTRRNLELTENSKDRKKIHSLLWLLDKTKTSMGARYLRSIVEQPLYNEKMINHRLKGVEELVKNIYLREEIGEVLYDIYDIERICGKVSYGNIMPKDCNSLKHSLNMLPKLKELLTTFKSDILCDISNKIYDYTTIVDLIDRAIVDNPPITLKEGGYIKAGYSTELDELNSISKDGKKWILELEAREKELTGIKNLKIAYNKVFGYYIEVTNSQKDMVPFRYQRRQTLANAERFVTDELKQMESKILNAEENKLALEERLFKEICMTLKDNIISMQESSKAIAMLDAILSLANVAVENNYCKPTITKDSVLDITDGRHPIVEAILRNEEFVPNDTHLDNNECRTMIITGPNMAGKSTYMRQVALITFMAHIGSYVPARSATIGLVDRIFTRVGASDDLSFGQSTFMVEMVEVSNILKNATNNSLIILDEVGRGTSTFDGLSIAWSVMDYISNHLLAKTLFSTHYHELTELEGILDGVKNYQISVKEFNGSVIFLRKIVRGGANRSFGIEVASLAGLPEEVLQNARKILKSLEDKELASESNISTVNESYAQKDKIQAKNSKQIISILNDLDINTLSPLSAFDTLIQLKNYLDKE